MKTFKQLRNELAEDYGVAWQKVKSGASDIGSGAIEASKTFVKRDLPILVKKAEKTYTTTIKPTVKKSVSAVGSALETGGKELKKAAE